MRKAFLLVCALFILLALLFLPSIEARALLQEGTPCPKIRVAPCSQYPPGCIPGKTCFLPPEAP
ncbi:hypothetical protein ACJRO7_035643 [Eucalyptus globulus]|uniref:Uncharacterized protein n=1 Tax=Eucalyptus globulus TaxID=34317 RepID=A0ABD3J9G5_EUCGL